MGLNEYDTKFIDLFLKSIETSFMNVFQCELQRGQIYFMRNQLSEDNVAILTGCWKRIYRNGGLSYA